MADYFTYFSLVFKLPTEAAQQYALELDEKAQHIRFDDEKPTDRNLLSGRSAVHP